MVKKTYVQHIQNAGAWPSYIPAYQSKVVPDQNFLPSVPDQNFQPRLNRIFSFLGGGGGGRVSPHPTHFFGPLISTLFSQKKASVSDAE